MPSGKGKIVLMGSGELTATMVEVHKSLLSGLQGSPQAAFLDTPAGFQLNVDQISLKAVEYFRKQVRHPLAVCSFKSRTDTTDIESAKAFRILRESAYILIGPGRPTYAVAQWNGSPVPEIFTRCINNGGCLVAASAAALTVGRFTLPVYEIYKVGQQLHWVEGIDILGRFGLELVVIPHWNNAEGGTHDTRFCFMGAPRFEKLVALLAENIPVLGLDEHTACILDLATNEAEVKGIGTVVFRKNIREVRFKSGDRFPIDVLRGAAAQNWHPGEALKTQQPDAGGREDFWDRVHSLEDRFHRGIADHDAGASTNALLELDSSIWQAQTDLENEEFITQARDLLRELIVLLGSRLSAASGNEAKYLRPLVDALLKLRQRFRAGRQWNEADAIRELLNRVGITVEDSEEGSRWQTAAKP